MTNYIKYLSFTVLLLLTGLFLQSCLLKDSRSKDDLLLARVYNKNLYLSDMEGMLPIGISSEDSSIIIEKFVKRWVRETAMLHEAEQNIPQGLDIDQLVENYRASLIKHNYENIVVDNLLDSVVSKIELDSFYEKNKEQYQLESPIIKCRFIKIGKEMPGLDTAERLWKSTNLSDKETLKKWCENNATVHHLNDSIWYKVVDIGAYMPQGFLTVDNVGSKKQFIQKDDHFVYMFELKKLVTKKEIAPLAYIEDQARKVILHKRKMELLEELKDKLFDEALRSNGVSFYNQ